jgi:hypothetical protein
MTRRDLLHRNVDLIEHAGKILKKRPVQRLIVEKLRPSTVGIGYENLLRIDVYLDDRPLQASLNVKRSSDLKYRALPLRRKIVGSARELRLQGFRLNPQGQPELVAASRLVLCRHHSLPLPSNGHESLL